MSPETCDLCGTVGADSIDTGSEFVTLCDDCEVETRPEEPRFQCGECCGWFIIDEIVYGHDCEVGL